MQVVRIRSETMPDVMIFADTMRSPEMRHEVPVSVPDPFLYVERNGSRHAILTSFEVDRVAAAGIHAHPLEEFGWDELVGKGPREQQVLVLYERAVEQLGVEDAVVPRTFPLELADRLRAKGLKLTADGALFAQRRRVKTEPELAGIRKAQRGTEAAMAAARDMLRAAQPGDGTLTLEGEPLTSERIKARISDVFSEHNLVSDAMIVAHGAQGAEGHEMGSGPIAPGESVVIDLFPRDIDSGCYADMTRTFVVGDVPDELAVYHRLVHEALQRSIEAVRAEADGNAIYRLACDVFHEAGQPTQLSKKEGEVLSNGFFHGLGHGVGLEVHEQPWLSRDPSQLVAGDVITLEPGLYRQGFGGVRLEDLVLVTNDGAENLTAFPYDLQP
jgi:Xaa-Pro aminopeptidase